MISTDSGNTRRLIVTFVWRDATANNVSLLFGGGDPADLELRRLQDTDVWSRSYALDDDVRLRYWFLRDVPASLWHPDEDNAEFNAYIMGADKLVDPLNPATFSQRRADGNELEASLVALPKSLPDDLVERSRTTLVEDTIASAILGNSRRLWTFNPKPDAESPGVLIVLDGGLYLSVGVHAVIEQLVDRGSIKPLLVVFVDNADSSSRDFEFPCSAEFARFVDQELAAWLQVNFDVSDSPADWCVAGGSLGGLAAAWLGFQIPHRIGNVISQGGAFWWGPGWNSQRSPLAGGLERDWFSRQFENPS